MIGSGGTVDLHAIVDQGLGNSAYLVDLGDGRALAVDAARDLRALHTCAQQHGLQVAFAADTHLHADFLSGVRDLAAGGARVLASAAGGRQFPHEGLREGDQVDLGGLVLRALATPGHTPEHLSYLLLDGSVPLGVFTGGSLIVGAAARTDLFGPARTEPLGRQQWHSLQRLAQLPDATAVWPTHGAGSFCAAPPGAARTSTIGREKQTNPLLNAGSEQAFIDLLMAGLGAFPPYFLRLGEANRLGPHVLTAAPALPALDPQEVARLGDAGALLVDVRPVEQYAASHVAGALSIPLRGVFATWLGWAVAADRPVVIVRDGDQDQDEIVWQAAKIGYDQLVGELTGGMASWTTSGRASVSTQLLGADELDGRAVVDVRQRVEFDAGHVRHASNVELGRLAAGLNPDEQRALVADTTAVMCGHGERAMTAVSLLERTGARDLAVVVGGPEQWAAHSGQPLEVGP